MRVSHIMMDGRAIGYVDVSTRVHPHHRPAQTPFPPSSEQDQPEQESDRTSPQAQAMHAAAKAAFGAAMKAGHPFRPTSEQILNELQRRGLVGRGHEEGERQGFFNDVPRGEPPQKDMTGDIERSLGDQRSSDVGRSRNPATDYPLIYRTVRGVGTKI